MESGSWYVVPLDDRGTEALSFAPLDEEGAGWARYFREDGSEWALVFVRFGFPPPRDSNTEREPIRVRELHLYVEQGEALSSVARNLPFGRFESAVNQPRHYQALSPALGSERFGQRIPKSGSWRSDLPDMTDVKPPLQLDIPEGRQRKPDAFYEDVANAFSWLATTSSRPAEDMATINHVAVTTVHRWVREARSRGALPPATGRGARRKGNRE